MIFALLFTAAFVVQAAAYFQIIRDLREKWDNVLYERNANSVFGTDANGMPDALTNISLAADGDISNDALTTDSTNTAAHGAVTAYSLTLTNEFANSAITTSGTNTAAHGSVTADNITLTNGATVTAGGFTVTAGGATITAGGLAVTAGDVAVGTGDFDAATNELVFLEHSVTGAPPAVANSVLVYARDNGSGKTLLIARMPSGDEQTLATEP